ncbi:hypothetical protein K438DRAFT_1937409 [Mycena galopus ATCC 62051]|nr:hypothetical protein K438DRAFT_1937409 [Mycena galopus ATCC 62051]
MIVFECLSGHRLSRFLANAFNCTLCSACIVATKGSAAGIQILLPLLELARTSSALRDLYLGETTIEFAIELLSLRPNWCLVNLRIGTKQAATKSDTHQLYAALAVAFRSPDSPEMSPSPGDPFANYVVDGHTLAALFCFGNLTEITLIPPVGFDIDDAMAWDMARAWPKVKTLRLSAGSSDSRHPSSLSILSLRAFATHCPELTSLWITFASTVPRSDDPHETHITQTSLTSLDVDISPIADPRPVAKYIAAVFPNLETISTHDDWIWAEVDPEEEESMEYIYYTRWIRLATMLQRLRAKKRLSAPNEK